MFFKKKANSTGLPQSLQSLMKVADICWLWNPHNNSLSWSNYSGFNFWRVENRTELRSIVFENGHDMTVTGLEAFKILKDDSTLEFVEYDIILSYRPTHRAYRCLLSLHILPDGRDGLLVTILKKNANGYLIEEDNSEEDINHVIETEDGWGSELNNHLDSLNDTVKITEKTNNPKLTEKYNNLNKPITPENTFQKDEFKKVNILDKDLKQAEHAIFLSDGEGRILDLNAAAREHFLLVKNALITDIFYEKLKIAAFLEKLEAQEAGEFTAELVTISGHSVCYVFVIPTPEGNFIIEVMKERDVKHNTPEKAALSENRASAMLVSLDAVGMGVLLLNTMFHIETVNNEAAKLLNHSVENLVEQEFIKLFSNEYTKSLKDLLKKVDENNLIAQEITLPFNDFILHLTIRKQNDAQKGYWVIIREVSEIQKLKGELDILKQQLTKVNFNSLKKDSINPLDNAETQNILSTLSHEIRTPLNAIMGFSELLISQPYGSLGHKKYNEYAQTIREASEYVVSIANDLLDFTKISAGKMEATILETNVADIVNDTIKMLWPIASKRDLRISQSILQNCPHIMADSHMLKQVIVNILMNAINYSFEGSTIYVTAGATRSGRMMIEIANFGKGMTEEQIQKAMEPFSQVHRKQDSNFKGTGLGLPLAKKMCDTMNARLAIDSVPGEKTRVRIVFSENAIIKA